MNGVTRITVHHEGSDAFTATSQGAVAARLEDVRRCHRHRKGWSDIGYHYIIDGAGRVWEGRPLEYQGAHVRDHNEHNIGVMALGNFDIQHPTHPQLSTCIRLVRELRQRHGVRLSSIRTHRQWVATSCPGRWLQAKFMQMKNNGFFV